jgi:amino acid transporter
MVWNQLFAKKSLELLDAEAKGENRLRRVLGPISLTSLGIGAIIGAGIFVMTGRTAAVDAGPAVVLSYVVAGIGCVLAALCYAEFASTAPVAGSAYTYAYATLGELFAWFIGWDLVLEYAMACAVVAAGWSEYLNEFLRVIFQVSLPDQIMSDPFTTPGAWFNLPSVFIVAACTIILVIGIRESATTNAVLVMVKVGVVLFVIAAGIAFVQPKNWTSVPVEDRLTPQQILIPEQATRDVKEGTLTPQQAQERVDAITKEVRSLWADKPLTGQAAEERTRKVRRQIETLYVETARLPKRLAEARVEMLTDQALAVYRINRRRQAGELTDQEADARINQALAANEALFQVQLRREEGKVSESVAKAAVEVQKIKQQRLEGRLSEEDARLRIEHVLSKPPLTEKERQQIEPLLQGVTRAPIEEDRKVVARLLAEVEDKAPEKAAEKWGLLGNLGVNQALERIDDSVRSPFIPYGLSGIMLGAAIVFFAYIGFDAISTHSEEARRPQRDVPIGILASLGICTVLYIAVSAVITGMEPYPEIDRKAAVAAAFRHAAEAAELRGESSTLLRAAGGLIATGALAGLTSVLLITFLSQARIFLAMSRDGLLPPRIFAAIHPRFRTPHLSTMLTGGVICVVAAFTPISDLELMVNIGTLMAFVIVCAAVLLLRIQRPDAYRPFRCPAVFVVAPLGIVANLGMMLFLPPVTWLRLVGWLVIGLCIYFGYGLAHSTLGRQSRGLAPLKGTAAASILQRGEVEPAIVPLDSPNSGFNE